MQDPGQDCWDQAYRDLEYAAAPEDDPLVGWLRRWVPPGDGACLELGCFPGRYLAVLGGLGYELHGVDLTPRVESDFSAWLAGRGCRVGRFARADALSWEPGRRYDLVCSFGLIEHFPDWRPVLRSQARLVAEGGRLVVTAPNFRGALQWLLHRTLDERNLARHNLGSMNAAGWRQEVTALGFEVLFAGYVGSFPFWWGDQPRSRLQRLGLGLVGRAGRWLRRLPAGGRLWAPHCGLIARKGGGAGR